MSVLVPRNYGVKAQRSVQSQGEMKGIPAWTRRVWYRAKIYQREISYKGLPHSDFLGGHGQAFAIWLNRKL